MIPYADNDTGPEKVILYQRKTGETKTLDAQSSTRAGDIWIAIGSGLVLWSFGKTDENNQRSFQINSYDLKTGKTSVFLKDAAMPVIGDDFIAWLGPAQAGTDKSLLYDLNTASGKTTVIQTDINPQYLAACGDTLVFSGPTLSSYSNFVGHDFHLLMYQNGSQKLIDSSQSHDYEFPQVSGRFISWDENRKKRVYDIRSNTILDLNSDYGEAFVSDHRILWGTDAIANETKEQAEKDGMYQTDALLIMAD